MEAKDKAHLEQLAAEVETQLLRYVQVTPETKRQAQVVDAMRYSLEAGGKRIRPVLVLEFCRIFGGTKEQAMAAACALEMVHTFSLIHDDLPEMDNDDYRRGKPSCHKAFGHAVALQAGDALLTEAFRVIVDDPILEPEMKVELLHILTEATGAAGMVDGQIMDMANEKQQRRDPGRAGGDVCGKDRRTDPCRLPPGLHCRICVQRADHTGRPVWRKAGAGVPDRG